MITRLMGALFAPKYPPRYTGRHRAQALDTKASSPPPPSGACAQPSDPSR